jgi:tetratricopeptide (TPR) repeat protein
MARFDKLEFDASEEKSGDPGGSTRAELDEAYWMKKADEDRRRGLYENALKYYSRALEEDKSLVDGWLGQVQMLVQLDEAQEAELWSRKALEMFPSNGDLMAARAQACCRMGDSREAHALNDGAIRQEGLSAYRWMVRGELLLAGKQEMEVHCFDKAQQIDSDWLVPTEIGLIYLHYGKPSKALNRIRHAVETAPDEYHLWYLQGRCQMKLGFVHQARQSFQRCLDLCPRHADSLSCLEKLAAGGWSPSAFLRRLFGRT